MGRRQRSCRSLAGELGWTQVYLNRRTRAEVSFSAPDLLAISRALGVPVSRFFEAPDDDRQGGSIVRYSGLSGLFRPVRWAA